MSSKDSRIDAYIAKSADFARPILTHLRQLVHVACPGIEETMKWSFPHFGYKGMLCSMAAFKQHCSFGFWKGELILGQSPGGARDEGMGHFGRITSVSDLPADKILTGYLKKAVQLNDAGVRKPNLPKRRTNKELTVPEDLLAALKKNRKALITFENFSYSHKKEYVEWITEAKRDETRQRRLTATLGWLAQGKPRHWQYLDCK